jgi:hypothetical protein
MTGLTGPARRRPRAQGNIRIPCPDGIIDEGDLCCVALRARVATPTADGGLTTTEDLPRVDWGPALPTLLDLVAYRFTPHARAVLDGEFEEIGWIDPKCPLRIERVTRGEHWHVFVDALVLPFGERQAVELGALMRAIKDPHDRHQAGWEYALRLEERWAAMAIAEQIPRAFADGDFRVTRAEDAPLARGPSEPLPNERELLPLST